MEIGILEEALKQGVWAALAIGLIFYNMKNQEKRDLKQDEREENYQKIILQITEQLKSVNILKEDISIIKKHFIEK